jgi:antitoxin VapB
MAISLKNLRAERLARDIASKTGESITGAIERSLEERLERIDQAGRQEFLVDQLEEIVKRVQRLPVLDPRTPEEIVGYDEHGLPR